MAWILTGNNSRDSRRKHRPAIEELDVRRLLSTGLGGALSGQQAARRAEAVQRIREVATPNWTSHRTPAGGGLQAFKSARLAARLSTDAPTPEAPAGAVATGAATAFDPIIGSAQARSTYGVDGSGLTVAVIDTGVNYNNSALGGGFGLNSKVIAGFDFGDDDADPYASSSQHGTAVAGLIAGDDAGHLGVAPGADIVALKVTDGTNTADTNKIADALQWVVDHHSEYNISVVNISLSNGKNYARNWFAQDGGVGQRMTQLVQQLKALNIPVVAATGNSFAGSQGEGFTAVLDGVISVTASDPSDKIMPTAQRLGSAVGGSTATDLAAPGSGIAALIDGSSYSNVEGTSFAAPLVSGSIVLLQSVYKARFGSLPTVDQLNSWLEQGAKSIHDDATGIDLGRLDVLRSASLIPGAPVQSTTPTTPVVTIPPAQQVLTPPTNPVDYTPASPTTPSTPTPPSTPTEPTTPPTTPTEPTTPTPPSTPTAPTTPSDPVEPTPTTLEVPVILNGKSVDSLSTSSVAQAASTTKLARADVGQLLLAMSKWASSSAGSRSVRAWSVPSSK